VSEAVVLPLPEPAPTPVEPSTPSLGPRWAVIGIFLLLLIAGLAYARAFLMPVVLAVLLQMVFTPVRRALERMGLPAALSATLIVLSLLGVLVAAVAAFTVPVTGWIEQAPSIGRQLEQKASELRGATGGVIEAATEAASQVEELAGTEADPDVQRVVVEENGGVLSLAMTVPNVLAQLLFTLVLLFFMLSSGDMFYEKIVHVLPTFKDKVRAIRIARDIERALSHYLFTITAINAGLGLAIGVAMWLLGMPNPALLGVMGFLLNFIPYVGAVVGVAVAAVVGLVSLDHVSQAVVVALTYFTLTSVEGQLLTPYFVGRRLRLNTVVVFLSVTLFAWLWSVVGMLVATPLLVMIRIFCEHIPALNALGDFLSERGAEREDEAGASG
jgi:predicted PurR-regulated permease PerM